MKKRQFFERALAWGMVLLMALPPGVLAQQSGSPPALTQQELDQILAPVALYPDPLVSQILMASTYPLEVVEAGRWAKQNPNLKGDALTKALEAQNWDPSVKSLVNFPQVLSLMSDKIDLTQKIGDAFLSNQKMVLDTIQSLRAKAQAAGNLKTTSEQKVIVEEKIIKIEPANPQVIYVPTYNPAVVYGVWPYPAYPPYSYYPLGYVWAAPFAFAAGVGLGMAWGYAWGSCNWRGGSVHYNYNQNININRNINRTRYAQGGQGNWQHNAEHRRGVSYRDQGTAQRYNRAGTNEAIKSREQFRGRAEQGRQELARGGAGERGGLGGQGGVGDRGGAGSRPGAGAGDRGGASQLGGGRAGTADRGGGGGNRGGAFEGVDRGGSAARSASQRGSSSMGSFGGGGSRGGGFSGGGGARGGGGGGRRR
jgi:hypothetical protein